MDSPKDALARIKCALAGPLIDRDSHEGITGPDPSNSWSSRAQSGFQRLGELSKIPCSPDAPCPEAGSKAWCTCVADARLAGCKKSMGPTGITSDVVSSVFASRECGLLLGDAREVLRTLFDDSVDCTVTSPPYYSGRRHVGDTVHEIGSERTVEEYVEALVSVGREVCRVTTPTGSYWLNVDDRCERNEWLGIPWRVAFAMREMGWKIRNEVIWHKPKHVRSVTQDRLTSAHELLFHFVKSKDAYYNMDAIRKPSSPPILGTNGVVKTPSGRVPTDVWTIQNEDSVYPEGPYAVFPEALVELPIRATCPRG